ncbi:MAG: sugar phosphate isomerase/epimerase [Fibrobacteres bacterium]|nr:sugar phosphate isomerase/epimerase [Fibrobacterota bacterium]
MNTPRIGCNTLETDSIARKTAGWSFTMDKLKKSIDIIAEAGYTDVEYSHIHHLTVKEGFELGQYTISKGLNNWSCHAAGPKGHSVDTVEGSIAANIHCIDVAAAIGAKVNVLHIWNFSHTDACRVLEKIVPYAEANRIDIALENFDTLKNMEFIMGLVNSFDSPNLGINVDTGHANIGDLGAGRALRMAGKKLLTTHIHDNFGKIDDHMPPGTGNIDWADVFKAFEEIGYKRTFMVELTDSLTAAREHDLLNEIEKGLQNLRKMCLKV